MLKEKIGKFVYVSIIIILCTLFSAFPGYLIYKIAVPPRNYIFGCKIWKSPYSFANGMVVVGKTIIDIGDYEEMLKKYKNEYSVLYNCKYPEMIIPGLIDHHTHLFRMAQQLSSFHLNSVLGELDFYAQFENYTRGKTSNEWVVGTGWTFLRTFNTSLNRSLIDHYAFPVVLYHADYQMALANQKALIIAQIGVANHTDPHKIKGGTIQVNADGVPTGILTGNAVRHLSNYIPIYKKAFLNNLRTVLRQYVEAGITQIHDMGTDDDRYVMFDLLKDLEYELQLKIHTAFPIHRIDDLVAEMRYDPAYTKTDSRIRLGLVHGAIDGSFETHTAQLLQPYSDRNTTGELPFLLSKEELNTYVRKCIKNDLSLSLDATGDGAVAMVLDVFDAIYNESVKIATSQFILEHCPLADDALIKRLRSTGLLRSLQPDRLNALVELAEHCLGEERKWNLLRINSLQPMLFGSGSPPGDINPLFGLHRAVNRETVGYPQGFNMNETIGVDDALYGYTWDVLDNVLGIYSQDDGSILDKGVAADFVIIDRDLFEIHAKDIHKTRVLKTYINGVMVFATGENANKTTN